MQRYMMLKNGKNYRTIQNAICAFKPTTFHESAIIRHGGEDVDIRRYAVAYVAFQMMRSGIHANTSQDVIRAYSRNEYQPGDLPDDDAVGAILNMHPCVAMARLIRAEKKGKR